MSASRSTLASAIALVAACTGGNGSTGPPSTDVTPDRPPHMDPATIETCPGPTAPNGAVVAMPWRGNIETFLPPSFMGDAIAIDYGVHPSPRITSVTMAFDFDPMATIAAWTVTSSCPATIMLSEFQRRVGDGVLARTTIEATASDGTLRRGRLVYSTGHGVATVRVAGLGLGTSTDPWWLLFEPASGARRMLVIPVAIEGRDTAQITGLPNDAGTVALVQSAMPSVDGMGVVHAPSPFVGSWRIDSVAWFARSFINPPSATQILTLDEFVSPRGTTTVRMLNGDQHFTGMSGTAMVRAFGVSGGASLFWPCTARTVRVATEGLADLTFTVGAATATSTVGQAIDLPLNCAAGATESSIAVAYSAFNNRGISISLAWTGGGP